MDRCSKRRHELDALVKPDFLCSCGIDIGRTFVRWSGLNSKSDGIYYTVITVLTFNSIGFLDFFEMISFSRWRLKEFSYEIFGGAMKGSIDDV